LRGFEEEKATREEKGEIVRIWREAEEMRCYNTNSTDVELVLYLTYSDESMYRCKVYGRHETA